MRAGRKERWIFAAVARLRAPMPSRRVHCAHQLAEEQAVGKMQQDSIPQVDKLEDVYGAGVLLDLTRPIAC